MGFYGLFKVANQKARKAMDNVRVILNKFTYLCSRQVFGVFSPHLFPAFDHFGSCCCKKQIDVSFLSVCPLVDDKFHHNIVKVYCRTTRLWLVAPQPL